jgi:RND family efflux transporter MFP subunit
VKRAAIDEAEARVEAAKARLRQAQADLDNTAIKAPFDAIVDIKRVDLGQYVQAGSPVMKLLSTSKAEVRLPVLAADIPFVQYGQRPDGSWHQATLISHFGDLDFRWQARLLRLEKRVDERTRVFYLIAEIEQPYDTQRHKHPLSVGLFVEADIPGREIENAVRLPRSAVHAGSLVYRVEQGVLRKREVTVLRKEQDTVIVGEGLDLGDIVVLSRLDLMVDGMAVSVEP